MTGEPGVAFDGEATEELLNAMEANMAAHMAYLPRFLPGATVIDGPDLVLVDSGLSSDTLNTICLARLDPATADGRIATAIDHFRVKDFPFAWWVGPVSRPADLGVRLTARGLVEAEAEVGMALDLARLHRSVAAAGGTRRAASDHSSRADGLRLGGGRELGSARSRNRRVLRARRCGRACSGMPGAALCRISGRRAGRNERVLPGARRVPGSTVS